MKTDYILVTPSLAVEMLEKNDINRPLNVDYAKFLAKEMLEGRWRDKTGVPIILNSDGTIIDGQHRLRAVIIANKPIRFTVTSGISKDVIDVIDTGKGRSSRDVLSMMDIPNAASIAGIIKFVHSNGLTNYSKDRRGKGFLSNRATKDEYLKDPDFWQRIALFSDAGYKQFRPIGNVFLGGCIAIALRESKFPQRVMEFFEQLVSGKDCSDAVLSLRRKLINNQLDSKKYTSATKRELVQGFFNGHIKGQKNPYAHPENKWL